MAISTPFSNTKVASASGGFDSPEAKARRQALVAAINGTVAAPQSPPPPVNNPWGPPTVQPPKPVLAVTGGAAPVGSLAPNQIAYDTLGNVVAVGGKPVVPGTTQPTQSGQVTGGQAPTGSLNPNQVAFDSFGNVTAVGGKTPVVAPTGTASMITGTAAPVATTPATGGAAPTAPTRVTGGAAPAATAPVTGGTAPVATAPANPFPTTTAPVQVYQPNMGAGNVVQDYLSQLLSSDSPYIQNARRNGIEAAANRGLLNSTIAAGNSQREAIAAAQPILNEITQLHNQREQLAFTGEQNQMDRDQQITMARINDWAANNQFMREYNGQLSLLPIKSVTDLNNSLMQAAIDNPEIFPPEIVSGLGEFFGSNLLAMLQNWFPNQYGGG